MVHPSSARATCLLALEANGNRMVAVGGQVEASRSMIRNTYRRHMVDLNPITSHSSRSARCRSAIRNMDTRPNLGTNHSKASMEHRPWERIRNTRNSRSLKIRQPTDLVSLLLHKMIRTAFHWAMHGEVSRGMRLSLHSILKFMGASPQSRGSSERRRYDNPRSCCQWLC